LLCARPADDCQNDERQFHAQSFSHRGKTSGRSLSGGKARLSFEPHIYLSLTLRRQKVKGKINKTISYFCLLPFYFFLLVSQTPLEKRPFSANSARCVKLSYSDAGSQMSDVGNRMSALYTNIWQPTSLPVCRPLFDRATIPF
jgi:hypothetical protein